MRLTAYEQEMLDGLHGKTIQKCMKLLVALGTIYGAEDMVEVTNVHSPGVSYRVAGNAGLNYVKEASEDAVFCVPTTLNTIGIDEDCWEKIGFPEEFAQKQIELNQAYRKMGAIPVNTCTPFLCGNLPRFGESIAWGESSAICFANSVIGARTNREGGPTALAAGITGRVPRYGFHLDQNRKATYQVKVEVELKDDKDFAALGYYIGKRVGSEVPVFTGIRRHPTLENYKALCAALASSGAVALFHIVGFTPEAPTLESVLGNCKGTFVFDEAAYTEVNEKFGTTGPIDFVVIGCPHVSIVEMGKIADMLRGKKLQSAMWVCTSRQVKQLADRMGYSAVIQEAGAEIICDTCPVLCCTLWDRGYKTIATNSGKLAHYAPGHWKLQPVLLTAEECVQTAINGNWRG